MNVQESYSPALEQGSLPGRLLVRDGLQQRRHGALAEVLDRAVQNRHPEYHVLCKTVKMKLQSPIP